MLPSLRLTQRLYVKLHGSPISFPVVIVDPRVEVRVCNRFHQLVCCRIRGCLQSIGACVQPTELSCTLLRERIVLPPEVFELTVVRSRGPTRCDFTELQIFPREGAVTSTTRKQPTAETQRLIGQQEGPAKAVPILVSAGTVVKQEILGGEVLSELLRVVGL